jgi:hypothetical protein
MAFTKRSIAALALLAAFALPVLDATAHDEAKYPDWSGQWRRPRGLATQWDQDKKAGLAQEAPLKPEYQKMLEWSMADQAAGGQGLDTRYTCITNGMPRMMAVIQPIEFVILPNITGKWSDTDGDGRFDTLEVETRNFKGPRTVEFSGIPLHEDNQTVVKEKISLDKSNPDLMHNIITIIDNAFTRPWTVDKRYRRDRNVMWFEDNCTENNHHVVIGKENYFVNHEGYLMPARKNQAPPDLRFFNANGK